MMSLTNFYFLLIVVNIFALTIITTLLRFVLSKILLKKSLEIIHHFLLIKPSLEMDKVLPKVIEVVDELVHPLRCSLMLVDNDGFLKIKIGKNISNYSSRGLKLHQGEGIAGKVLQTGVPVVVNDISKTESYYKLFSPEIKPVKKEKLVSIPIKFEDKNYGVLNLHFSVKNKFPRKWYDKYILKIISIYVSNIIHNCYTYFDAVSDSMTKLYNHQYIIKRLQEEMYIAKKFSTKLSFVMFDIDHFKQINDNYGHQIGDVVITVIANIVKNNIRLTDIAGRYGGEEFCIILPHTSLQEAVCCIERIKNNISSERFVANETNFTVTCSFGVKEFDDEKTPLEFISSVDALLYKAKMLGRDRICY